MADYKRKVEEIRESNQKVEKYSYIAEGAKMICSEGKYTCQLKLEKPRCMTIESKAILTEMDGVDGAKEWNVADIDFKNCDEGGRCKAKVEYPWINPAPDMFVNEQRALLNISECYCSKGGIIVFINNGQEK